MATLLKLTMNNETFNKIFELSKPYLQKATMKDFVTHTKHVVKAMEMIIRGEGGDSNILIPAAILHDVGFSKVSPRLQTNNDLKKKRQAQRQHLVFAKEIIQEILEKVDYKQKDIDRITEIIVVHKFHNPDGKEERMLIDSDNLSDTFLEQFYSDIKAYNRSPEQVYEFRTRNEYYTKTAKKIASKNMSYLQDKIRVK